MPERHIAPRHRSPRSLPRSLGRFAGDVVSAVPGKGLTGAAALVGAAGIAVGLGVITVDTPTSDAAADVRQPAPSPAPQPDPGTTFDDRRQEAAEDQISRSGVRLPLTSVQRETKDAALPVEKQVLSGATVETVEPDDPREIAQVMLAEYGWSGEFSCLDQLYTSESNWDPHATNPTSGAYGIPQSLPAEKMASAGADWQTNPATQIEWGLEYIQDSYGSPCAAWDFKQGNNWY